MNTTGVAWGIGFVLVGAVVLLADIGVLTWRPGSTWPLLLMVIGAGVLLGGLRGRRADRPPVGHDNVD